MDEFGIFTPLIDTPDVRVWPLYTHAEFDIDITFELLIIQICGLKIKFLYDLQ